MSQLWTHIFNARLVMLLTLKASCNATHYIENRCGSQQSISAEPIETVIALPSGRTTSASCQLTINSPEEGIILRFKHFGLLAQSTNCSIRIIIAYTDVRQVICNENDILSTRCFIPKKKVIIWIVAEQLVSTEHHGAPANSLELTIQRLTKVMEVEISNYTISSLNQCQSNSSSWSSHSSKESITGAREGSTDEIKLPTSSDPLELLNQIKLKTEILGDQGIKDALTDGLKGDSLVLIITSVTVVIFALIVGLTIKRIVRRKRSDNAQEPNPVYAPAAHPVTSFPSLASEDLVVSFPEVNFHERETELHLFVRRAQPRLDRPGTRSSAVTFESHYAHLEIHNHSHHYEAVVNLANVAELQYEQILFSTEEHAYSIVYPEFH